jgi:hypothetical protein
MRSRRFRSSIRASTCGRVSSQTSSVRSKSKPRPKDEVEAQGLKVDKEKGAFGNCRLRGALLRDAPTRVRHALRHRARRRPSPLLRPKPSCRPAALPPRRLVACALCRRTWPGSKTKTTRTSSRVSSATRSPRRRSCRATSTSPPRSHFSSAVSGACAPLASSWFLHELSRSGPYDGKARCVVRRELSGYC